MERRRWGLLLSFTHPCIPEMTWCKIYERTEKVKIIKEKLAAFIAKKKTMTSGVMVEILDLFAPY
jgi:hypothetical protein